jgi:hypothetical protein
MFKSFTERYLAPQWLPGQATGVRMVQQGRLASLVTAVLIAGCGGGSLAPTLDGQPVTAGTLADSPQGVTSRSGSLGPVPAPESLAMLPERTTNAAPPGVDPGGAAPDATEQALDRMVPVEGGAPETAASSLLPSQEATDSATVTSPRRRGRPTFTQPSPTP